MIKKLRIGNLTNYKKKCNCGKTAYWYIFTLDEEGYAKMYYKCNNCMKLIVETIDKTFTEINN